MESCPQCGAPATWSAERCASCGFNLGFPNVRAANALQELSALESRLGVAEEAAAKSALTDELCSLIEAVNTVSSVVVAMRAEVALNLVTGDASQYVNYEKLVQSDARAPGEFANDAQRAVVAGALFGAYGNQIIYGALSLDDRGLSTYGDVFCRLKTVSVEARTSFLEMNSYDFVKQFGYQNHPPGYRANWQNRAKLVAIKMMGKRQLRRGQGIADWQRRLLVSDGSNRNLDEFIEAHIFGTFTLHSIEKIVPAEPVPRHRRRLVDLVVNTFEANRLTSVK